MVVGVDGLHSAVAAAVRPAHYDDKPPLLCGYYAYWSGLPTVGRFENYIRPIAAGPPRRSVRLPTARLSAA
jgi:hypothetical protein